MPCYLQFHRDESRHPKDGSKVTLTLAAHVTDTAETQELGHLVISVRDTTRAYVGDVQFFTYDMPLARRLADAINSAAQGSESNVSLFTTDERRVLDDYLRGRGYADASPSQAIKMLIQALELSRVQAKDDSEIDPPIYGPDGAAPTVEENRPVGTEPF